MEVSTLQQPRPESLRTASPSQVLDPSEVQEAIRLHFSQLHGQLQLRQLALTEQLLQAAQSQRTAIRDTEAAAEEGVTRLQQLLSQAEPVLAGADGVAVTADLEPLLQQLSAASDRPCHLLWADGDADGGRVSFLADKTLLTSIGDHGKLEVDIAPPVRLLSDAELPADHVVTEITPDMLAEEEEPVRDTTPAVCSEPAIPPAAAAGTVELLAVTASRPLPPTPARPGSSPRPPSDRRLAAVFPAPAPAPVPAAAPAARDSGRTEAADGSLAPFGQERVLVTHINSPSQFYVQRCCQNRQLQELMRRVAQWSRNPDSKRNKHLLTLAKNELCLSQYRSDGRWYRARIIDVYPPGEEGAPFEYEVFYIDYGNQERVLESRLLPMSGPLARDHDMALLCTLWDLVPAGGAAAWSPRATHAFAELVRGESVAMTTISAKPGRPREVEMLKMPNRNIEADSPQSVRDHLVFLGVASYVGGAAAKRSRAAPGSGVAASAGRRPPPATPAVTVARMESATADRRQFYAPEHLARGSQTDVLVSHVDSPETFYIQQLGVHAEYLSNMMDEIQRVYAKSSKHALLNPQKGQVCVAQFSVDGKFYRAEIEILLSHGMVDVYYVDYGNRERISLQAVRKIEDKFMVIPKQALKCRLADIQPMNPQSGWEDAVRQQLIEATDNCVLKMYVDSVDSISHVVTLYKCRSDADICINALLAQLSCVRGTAPSTRTVEYTKVGWEPTREVPAASGSSVASWPPSAARQSSERTGTASQSSAGEAAPVATSTGSLDVAVCHCESPAKFSVQIRGEITTLERMMRELQELYGGPRAPSRHGYSWRAGDVAVARCRGIDQRFYRVRVLSVPEEAADQAKVGAARR
ncbi:tudor domain-containing protein 1-like [Amphibalanus amphitrite]|uniref:tudor domain-containing protein 1-like n=1 Tax=Amphibalanus amphitrite TaxID=1232801 RepID=UPI001C9243DD|nr:tudor domain-containing protein 1-like [Amphibalanus amphitrite]